MQERQPVVEPAEFDPSAVAHRVVDVATDKKAVDLHLLDIRPLTTLADFFVIMTGTSRVHIRALSENIREALAQDGVRALQIEGSADDGWVLMDLGSVVVHIFSADRRAFYGLEQLWSAGTTVVRIQ